MKVSAWLWDRYSMEHDQKDRESELPFYPSGYSPEVEETDTGYEERYLAVERSHQGPIPCPEDLDYYSQVLPDAPDRILRMAEQNAQSLRDLTQLRLASQNAIESNRHKEVSAGQKTGLLAVGIMAIVAIVALILKYPWVAGTICSTTIIGVAAVFVTGRNTQEHKNSGDIEEES